MSPPDAHAAPSNSTRYPLVVVFTSHWLALAGLACVLTALVLWACLLTAKLRHGEDNPYIGVAIGE